MRSVRAGFGLCVVLGCSTPSSSAPLPSRAARPTAPAARDEPRSLPIPPDAGPFAIIARDPVTKALLEPGSIYDVIWDELSECVSPARCPTEEAERARQKAASAFRCSVDRVLVARRDDARREKVRSLYRPDSLYFGVSLPEYPLQFSFMKSHVAAGFGKGDASAILRVETAVFYQAAGCGRWGLMTCAMANRSVRTPTTTYENTEDHVCFWGDVLHPGE
jgi:hypothetical protein